jgi:NADH:ubiquinone oxidoreductase subunit 6 (subunit J)
MVNLLNLFLFVVVSMNIYVLRHSKLKLSLASFLSGSTVSVLSSTCASCSTLGFLLVSTFGGVGIVASTFLSNYQTPFRVLSVALLIWALYSISNKLTKSCIINQQRA